MLCVLLLLLLRTAAAATATTTSATTALVSRVISTAAAAASSLGNGTVLTCLRLGSDLCIALLNVVDEHVCAEGQVLGLLDHLLVDAW